MFIDKYLNWNKHIQELSIKLSRANGILSKLRYNASLDTCLQVYYALFFSRLTYGCNLWGLTSEENIVKIERLQKKCVRILSFAPFNSHSNQFFIDLKILKVRDLISMSQIQLVHDFLNDRLPSDLMSLFTLSSNVHTTPQTLISASNSHIFIPSFNTVSYGKDSIRYQCAYLWNEIFRTGNIQVDENVTKNVNVVKMYSANSFKETLKKHYLFSYTIEEPDFLFY